MSKIADVLLIIDLQNGVCTDGNNDIHHLHTLINLVNELIEKYRKNNLPIIFVLHSDNELIKNSPSWKLYSDLTDVLDAFYINKTHANSFYNTGLKWKSNRNEFF